MKALNVKSVILFSSLFLLQCNNVTEKDNLSILKSTSSGFTKITGYIHNRDVYPKTEDISINVSHISGEDRVTQIKSPINDDGTFYFEIDLARPQDVTMQPYLDFLYLFPGDSLHIEIDFSNLSDIQLSGGKSVEINRDFYKYFDATGYRTTYFSYRGVGTDCSMNCTWAEIRKKMNEERDEYRSRRQTFLQKNNLCEEVIFLTEAMIELDYYKEIVNSILVREYVYSKETMDKKSMMDELNEVADKYFNADLYSNAHFKFIASAYIPAARFITQPDKVASNDDWKKVITVDWMNEVAKTDVIKDFMLTVMAGNALVRRDLNNFEKYSAHISNEYLFDRLLQEYRVTNMKMQNPENVSGYILGNMKEFMNGISFDKNNLLSEKTAQNYGKVHIINIGAAWCGPCKPVLNQFVTLMKEYADKDVCVSFICVSGDDEQTRVMYQNIGIDDKTVHFTTDEEWQFLQSNFAPMGLPYGILVNKKGVIVDFGTHVRPSELLLEKINSLLE